MTYEKSMIVKNHVLLASSGDRLLMNEWAVSIIRQQLPSNSIYFFDCSHATLNGLKWELVLTHYIWFIFDNIPKQ